MLGWTIVETRQAVSLSIIVCFLAVHISGVAMEREQPTLVESIRTFEQELEHLRQKLNIPGLSVAVLQGQEVVFARGFGHADVERKIPANENTPYHIGSLTKPFAAALVMQLVEAGELSLDSRMADILADASFSVNDKTVQGYANLCEALKPFINYRGDTCDITVRHHLTQTSHRTPGEAYRYSGYLYGLLTEVLETVSGKRFEELLVSNIIAPLEMNSTIPNPDDSRRQQVLAERAKPYRIDNAGRAVFSRYPGRIRASAGMVSTVLDLAKFSVAMDRNLVISAESKQTMFAPTLSNSGHTLPYGIGWFVQKHGSSHFVWHYGWQPDAYSSLILKVLEEEKTLILLANSDGASAPFGLGEGDVLKSPFAVAFANLFTNIEVPSNP